MDIIVDWLTTSVATVIQGVMLVSVVVLLGLVNILNSTMAYQQAVNIEIQNHTEFNQYDNKHVYKQDIISVILERGGTPAITLVGKDNATVEWSYNSLASPLTATDVTNKVNEVMGVTTSNPDAASVKYDSRITVNDNGSIIGIEFKECTGTGCGCVGGY